jgi:hypothetical protein
MSYFNQVNLRDALTTPPYEQAAPAEYSHDRRHLVAYLFSLTAATQSH